MKTGWFRRKWWMLLLALATVAILVASIQAYFSRERIFRGKPESEWIANLRYFDEEQVKEWKKFGPEGVEVLTRGLNKANHPSERIYRKIYRGMMGHIPRIAAHFPVPKDSSRETRMCIMSVLRGLGDDARSATPVVVPLLHDEVAGVRMSAVSFFTGDEDDRAPLNVMNEKLKRKLLPEFLEAEKDSECRNNAVLALGYYRDHAAEVAPALKDALRDSRPSIRILATQSLYRVAPDEIEKSHVVDILVKILEERDDQVVYRAEELLGEIKKEPTLCVPPLIKCLESTNGLVRGTAIHALRGFKNQANLIVPALEKLADRKDRDGRDARTVLNDFKANMPADKK